MHIGIISITNDGQLETRTGTLARKGFIQDKEDLSRDASVLEFIYLTSFSAKTIIHDVTLPTALHGSTLILALKYELERFLPVKLTEVSWGFMRSGKDNCHFRIFAVMRSELLSMLNKISAANLRCDAFVPAQIFTENTGDLAESHPAELLLAHLRRDPGGKALQLDLTAISKSLRPERYRWLKKIYKCVLLLSALLILLQLLSRAGNHIDAYARLKSEELSIAGKLEEAENEYNKLQQYIVLYQKITDFNHGKSNIVPILADLSSRLPEHMWVSSYKQEQDLINLTIISRQDESNIARILESPLYTFINMSKSVNPANQNAVFLVQLRSLLP